MLSLLRLNKSYLVLLLCFLSALVTVLTPRVTASLLTNRGYLIFSAALVGKGGIVSLDNSSVERPQRYWEKAVELDSENSSAWRGLGWAYVVAGRYSSAVAAWRYGEVEAVDLVNIGEVARRNNDYETALIWYQQAVNVAPELADPWYYMGLAYVGMEKWEAALDAFQQGKGKTDRKTMGLGSIYYQIGWLAQRRLDPPDFSQAQNAYEMALALDDFSSDQERAQVHFSLGEILQQAGRQTEALQEYEWVVEHQPDHYWAHVQLGVLYWQYNGDLVQAERALSRAIKLDPQKKWAYRWMGAVYQQAGQRELAIKMYRRVLEIDSTDDVQKQLDQLMNGS